MPDDEAESYTVTLVIPADSDLEAAGERHDIRVSADEYVLYRARAEGFWLPADCQQGWCVTCGARLLEGELDHSDARRYYPEDAAAGFALLCRAKPRSDCVVEVEAYDELLRHRADHGKPPGRSKLD